MVIEGLLSCKKFFIKDTGVEVEIDRFDEDMFDKILEERFSISVKIMGSPTIEAIDKLQDYDLRKRTSGVEVTGHIKLEDLSLMPFEGAASQVLYSNKK